MPGNPFRAIEKLIRCNVVNRYNEESIRFIEFNNFKLWEYLMTNKHGIKIGSMSLCLWISEEEFKENESLYLRSGEVELVNRVVVDLFNEEYGFSNAITRFVRDTETEQIIKILTSHIPEDLINTDICQVDTYSGYSIIQKANAEPASMLGLE